MKKYFFLSAIVAMTLSGCTETIDEGVQSNVIGFTNVVTKPSRAVEGDLTKTSFDNFLVYAYYLKPGMNTPFQIFNGVPVRKHIVDGKSEWTYDGKRYWMPGCTYFFYAYSCADVELTTGKGNPAFSLFDATYPTVDDRSLTIQQYLCDATHQHDLVCAENEYITAKETGNPEVALSFKHSLCKVRALFTTNFPDGYRLYISNISISNFYNRGDYNVGTNHWNNYVTNQTNAPTISLNVPANSYIENTAGSVLTTSDVFLIPKLYDTKNSENVKLHFTVTINKMENGQEITIQQRHITGTWSPQWETGNIYQYSILIEGTDIGFEPIVFAANQDLEGTGKWTDATQLDMNFAVEIPEDGQ